MRTLCLVAFTLTLLLAGGAASAHGRFGVHLDVPGVYFGLSVPFPHVYYDYAPYGYYDAPRYTSYRTDYAPYPYYGPYTYHHRPYYHHRYYRDGGRPWRHYRHWR